MSIQELSYQYIAPEVDIEQEEAVEPISEPEDLPEKPIDSEDLREQVELEELQEGVNCTYYQYADDFYAVASSEIEGLDKVAINAFDDAQATVWRHDYSDKEMQWIQYCAYEPVVFNCVGIIGFNNCSPKDFQVLGSNDNTAWTILYEGTHTSTGNAMEVHNLNNETAFTYYRLLFLSGHVSEIVIKEIKFKYEHYLPLEPEICTDIQQADGFEVLASTELWGLNRYAVNAFDNNAVYVWQANWGIGPENQWIQVCYQDPIIFNNLKIRDHCGHAPKDFQIRARNDDEDWIIIHEGFQTNHTSLWEEHDFNNQTAYRYYRLYVITGYGSTLAIKDLEFSYQP